MFLSSKESAINLFPADNNLIPQNLFLLIKSQMVLLAT